MAHMGVKKGTTIGKEGKKTVVSQLDNTWKMKKLVITVEENIILKLY
jgi:hypothetical protein